MTTPPPARDHYEDLLARHYTWLMGGFSAKLAQAEAFFAKISGAPQGSGRAVDLGCGPGFQSLALAKAGFSIMAVDLSPTLLAELTAQARERDLDISTTETDLVEFMAGQAEPVELIACMGDTLPHLPSREQVSRMFGDAASALEPGGRIVLSFRDLSHELMGTDRFLPVRSDTTTIFTCFLEYGPEQVLVHDLVYSRLGPDGEWELHKSCYPKLRLAREWVAAELRGAGLDLELDEMEQGMVTLVGKKL